MLLQHGALLVSESDKSYLAYLAGGHITDQSYLSYILRTITKYIEIKIKQPLAALLKI